jgi:ADP-glucose pyrophosphorylase
MNSLLIMAGGASSRMKKSLENSSLSSDQKEVAQRVHKSLIPLGKTQKPLLFHLISNAVAAGYTDVYLITSPENEAFQQWVGNARSNNSFAGAKVHFALQHLSEGKEKPLGTADAVEQALEQYPALLHETFTICNGDNLYSSAAFKQLLQDRKAPNALISYARSGLKFSDERIAKFAVMDIDTEGFLKGIIEKPDQETAEKYRDDTGEIRVSMNIFSFQGAQLYPYLKNCPIHPERQEKELPNAIKILNEKEPKQILCFGRAEHILDLTAAQDIAAFEGI